MIVPGDEAAAASTPEDDKARPSLSLVSFALAFSLYLSVSFSLYISLFLSFFSLSPFSLSLSPSIYICLLELSLRLEDKCLPKCR